MIKHFKYYFVWIFLTVYFFLGIFAILILGNISYSRFFIGSYIILVSLSGFLYLPILWLKYKRKQLKLSIKILLILFLFTYFLFFLFCGIVILYSINSFLIIKLVGFLGIVLVTYGILSIISKEIILVIPYIKRRFIIKGIFAVFFGLVYIFGGALIFIYFTLYI